MERQVQAERVHAGKVSRKVDARRLTCARSWNGAPRCKTTMPPGARMPRSSWREAGVYKGPAGGFGVRQVQQHEVIPLPRAPDEDCTILAEHPHPRIAQRAAVDGDQLLACHLYHLLIDVDQRHLPDARVLQHLLRSASVPATQDQHLLRRRVRDRSGMDQGLVVEELVGLGGHEAAVEHQQEFAAVLQSFEPHAGTQRSQTLA
jgi:hypothetical protein